MAMNRIQFQPWLSMADFFTPYGSAGASALAKRLSLCVLRRDGLSGNDAWADGVVPGNLPDQSCPYSAPFLQGLCRMSKGPRAHAGLPKPAVPVDGRRTPTLTTGDSGALRRACMSGKSRTERKKFGGRRRPGRRFRVGSQFHWAISAEEDPRAEDLRSDKKHPGPGCRSRLQR